MATSIQRTLQPFRRGPCCGGILVCHNDDNERYLALVFGKQHRKWSFPKGHMKSGETYDQCMYREIEEETGLTESVLTDETITVSSPFRVRGDYYRKFEWTVPSSSFPPLVVQDSGELYEARWISETELLSPEFLVDGNTAVRHYAERLRKKRANEHVLKDQKDQST